MKSIICHIYFFFITSMIISGCSAQLPNVMNANYDQNPARIIALLPIERKTVDDDKTPQLLRARLLEELYYKGYPKLPLDQIDKKLESLYSNGVKGNAADVAPRALKDLVGADAGLYCAIVEGVGPEKLFYTPITIAVRCELRSAGTGEIIWKAQGESTSRNFDFTHEGMEMKFHEVLENVIEEVVTKVLKTLPDGPNLRG